jgi:hypothetical protein
MSHSSIAWDRTTRPSLRGDKLARVRTISALAISLHEHPHEALIVEPNPRGPRGQNLQPAIWQQNAELPALLFWPNRATAREPHAPERPRTPDH